MRLGLRRFLRIFIGLLLVLTLLPLAAGGVEAASTSVFVLRVGDGTAALASSATAGFIEERSISDGSLIRTINLPTAVSGSNRRLTFNGTSSSEGFLVGSVDGRYVTLAGYDADPGTLSIANSESTTMNRVVGRVDADGGVDTSTRISDAFSAANVRSSVTDDGSRFWTVGGNSGVRFVSHGSTGASTQISTTPANIRVITAQAGQLYVSSSSSLVGVSTVGTGLPTSGAQTVTVLPGFPTSGTGTPSPYGYVFYELNPLVQGLDTVYVADDRVTASGGGLQKWTYDGSTWSLVYTLTTNLTNGLRGLTGTTDGTGNPALIATSADNKVVKVSDTGSNSVFTTIATAGTNMAFRGIALAPSNMPGPTPTPSVVPDTGTVAADVTVPRSAACLELSVNAISFGTLPLGAEDQPASPAVTVTNCSGVGGTLLASATNASGAGAQWNLIDSAATCGDTLGTDNYHLALASTDLASPVALGTNNKTVQTLAAGASTIHTVQISTACPGSSGAGVTMSMAITFLATE